MEPRAEFRFRAGDGYCGEFGPDNSVLWASGDESDSVIELRFSFLCALHAISARLASEVAGLKCLRLRTVCRVCTHQARTIYSVESGGGLAMFPELWSGRPYHGS